MWPTPLLTTLATAAADLASGSTVHVNLLLKNSQA
jgi:hypothetical protein